MTGAPHDTLDRPARFTPRWWLRDPATGRTVIAQAPNAAIVVWVLAGLVRLLDVLPDRERELRGIGTGALVVWALDELVRGASPFRRLLGALVLGWQLVRLATA